MSTQPTTDVGLEVVLRAMQEIELLPAPTEWVLVAPDGRVWRGKPEEMMQVLAPYHPLLKPPSFMDMMP